MRPLLILSCLMLLVADARGAPGKAPRQVGPTRPTMSGYKDRPVPGDSRFPAEDPRPSGALLGRLPRGLVLSAERVLLACDNRGNGCAVRHEYVVRNPGPRRAVDLEFIAVNLAVRARVDGRLARITDVDPIAGQKQRHWVSTGYGVDPATGARYKLPGRRQRRPVTRHRFTVDFPTGGQRTITLCSHSVSGFDRFRRGRTQPEVSHFGTRRDDNFVHHHELRLRDPAARRQPGGRSGKILIVADFPRKLVLGSNAKITCRKVSKRRKQCTGTLSGQEPVLYWSLAEEHRRLVAFFLSVGAGFTVHQVEAHLRAGISLLLRRRRDMLSLAVETDAKTRAALSLVYQLFLPYRASTHEMGAHFELGAVLDVHPKVTPAIRAGAAFHFAFARVNLLYDIYPLEFDEGGPPAWRFVLSAGVGF